MEGNRDSPASEIAAFEHLICGFTGGIIRRAREIPEEKWNWSFSERTPTAREICEHAWMWLRSDRQEITVLDPARQEAIPDPPQERIPMLDLLESEAEAWRELCQSLMAPMLDELRTSPDGHCRSIRGTLLHMAQHIVSKSGQLTMLHFELGLDGGDPYDAPHPNRLYGFGSPAWPSHRGSSALRRGVAFSHEATIMLPVDFRTAIKNQTHAAFAMLAECVEGCPPSLWLSGAHPRPYWKIAYHATSSGHLFLFPDIESWEPWSLHRPEAACTFDEDDSAIPVIEPYTTGQVMEYVRMIQGQVDPQIDSLDLDEDVCGIPWYPDLPRAELLILNIRHISEHVGQLHELRLAAGLDVDWRVTRSY